MELNEFIEWRRITSEAVIDDLKTIDNCFEQEEAKVSQKFVVPYREGYLIFHEYYAIKIREEHGFGCWEELSTTMFLEYGIVSQHGKLKDTVKRIEPEYEFLVLTDEKLEKILKDKEERVVPFPKSFFDEERIDREAVSKNYSALLNYIKKEEELECWEELTTTILSKKYHIQSIFHKLPQIIERIDPEYELGVLTKEKMEGVLKRLHKFSKHVLKFPYRFLSKESDLTDCSDLLKDPRVLSNLKLLEEYIREENELGKENEIFPEHVSIIANFGHMNPIVEKHFGFERDSIERALIRNSNSQIHEWSKEEEETLEGYFEKIDSEERREFFEEFEEDLIDEFKVSRNQLLRKLQYMDLLPKLKKKGYNNREYKRGIQRINFPTFIWEATKIDYRPDFRRMSDEIRDSNESYQHIPGVIYESADGQHVNVLLPVQYAGIFKGKSSEYNDKEKDVITAIAQYLCRPGSFEEVDVQTESGSSTKFLTPCSISKNFLDLLAIVPVIDGNNQYIRMSYRKRILPNQELKRVPTLMGDNFSISLNRFDVKEYTLENTGLHS